MPMIERAVILAGGQGLRLGPHTAVLPKPLLPVGGVPILEIVVRQLRAAGVQRVTLAVGHLGSLVATHFGDGRRFGLRIDYSWEPYPLGTAGPLGMIDDLSDTCILMNADLLTDIDYQDLCRFHRVRGAAATIATYRREERSAFGIIDVDAQGRVTRYVEKPARDVRVSMGIYVIEPHVAQRLSAGTAIDFPELAQILIHAQEAVVAYPFSGVWLDIGDADGYAQAAAAFARLPHQFLPPGADANNRARDQEVDA